MLNLLVTVRDKDKKPYDNKLSGLWVDFRFQQPEDQTKFALPLNRDTEHLYYNTYLVIDAAVKTEPRVWEISKINRSNSKGIAVFTCVQELANQHTLKADYDEDGNVTAWWADWNDNEIAPSPAVSDDASTPDYIKSVITCSGKPIIKIGGSAKTFTVTYYDEEGTELLDHEPGLWEIRIDGKLVSNIIVTYYDLKDPSKLRFKFIGDDSYIGKILLVKNIAADSEASLEVEISAL